MKLLSDNIRRLSISIVLFLIGTLSVHADEIDPTDISYVSINPYTNAVTVSWYKSESANIEYVRILYIYTETTILKGKKVVDIYQNSDMSFTFSTDTLDVFDYESYERPIRLAVDAYCENGTQSTSLRENHTTMISKATITRCPSRIHLSWNAYEGFGITVDSYEIVEATDGTETVVATCKGTETDTYLDLNEHDKRSFFIRASFTDSHGFTQQSTSTMCEVNESASILPQYVTVSNISIVNDTDITLEILTDTDADYRTFKLFRSLVDSSHNIAIDSFQIGKGASNRITYTDKGAYRKDTDVYYSVAVYDDCGTNILESKKVWPFTAQATALTEMTNEITWTGVSFWDTVAGYRIWKSTNNEEAVCIDSVYATQLLYIDDIEHSFSNNYAQCYYIEAIEQSETTVHRALSNTICIRKEPILKMPNALNPISQIDENRTFKPKYGFISGDYELKIYDRNGTCIFSTDNIDEGWDGTVRGKPATAGLYNYHVSIVFPDGTNMAKNGSVHLIYN